MMLLLTLATYIATVSGMEAPALIPVSGNNFALVDKMDAKQVSRFSWSFTSKGYASARIGGVQILMHRFIMAPPPDKGIDHRNHNGLDNRRFNLRVSTQSQNCANQRKKLFAKPDRITTSKYRGVSWRPQRERWTAYVGTGKKRVSLGCFASEDEAALAYNKGAIQMYGEFAKLNVIDEIDDR